MKKNLNLLASLMIAMFLMSTVVSVAACKQNTDENTENSDGLIITVKEMYLWDNENGSFTSSDGKLVLKNGYKGANFTITNFDASEYKYAKLVYEKLDFPNVIFQLHYSDESYSEVFLQTNKTYAYIELDASKKSNISQISLMTREDENIIGVKTSSLNIKEIHFVNEKIIETKTAVTDKKTGSFDDKITGLELSDKIAVGLSLGSGLSACPYYNQKELNRLVTDFSEILTKNGSLLL